MPADITVDEQKRIAARAALDHVEPGMRLGLGTGSTAALFIEALGERVAGGLDVTCVPTSRASEAQAAALDIPLTTLNETPELDLTVDGADELDAALRLIKGGGGALLREKIVAHASRRMIVIADHSKKVKALGAFALPVEIMAFSLAATTRAIEQAARDAGCEGAVARRMAGGDAFKTDNGNPILDCAFGAIPDPEKLAAALDAIPGVVEHGLFIGLCDLALLGTQAGTIEQVTN